MQVIFVLLFLWTAKLKCHEIHIFARTANLKCREIRNFAWTDREIKMIEKSSCREIFMR